MSKVPEVTLIFWIIKILATTFGETGGDAVTMSWLGETTFSQTLGTALGDWVADTNEMGYIGAAAVFGGLLLFTALLYYFTRLARAVLFWSAFILTRPLGAVVGDFLDKPLDHGGLALSRYAATFALSAVIVALILVVPQRAARRAQ